MMSAEIVERSAIAPIATKFPRKETSFFFEDDLGFLWFNNGDELIRLDARSGESDMGGLQSNFSQIRQASTGEVLFNGFFPETNRTSASPQPEWSIPALNYEAQNLNFSFSASEYIDPESVRYRFKVEGSKPKAWSDWTYDKEFMTTNLREGRYTLHVQAKDGIGRHSSIASYSFIILPPWYRTFWAYLAYQILGIAGIFSAHKYLTMRRAHKLAAEQAKELEREREVVKKLSEANDRLTQANKLKDEFLATTSHELRTPLTAILGFTSVLKDEIPEEAEYRDFLDIIEDSSSRLMDTLNCLLDLAKLRAGIMDIHLEGLDLYQSVFQEVVQLQDSASRKGLKLKVRRPEKQLYALADMHGLGRIIHNLVGNAIKFTEDGMVEIWFAESSSSIDMHVSDTGIGIDEQFLPDLFDAFIQESDGLSRTYEGTGLGLAITSGIVQLMGASISVESRKGQGSDFVVSFQKADGPRRQARRMPGLGHRANA